MWHHQKPPLHELHSSLTSQASLSRSFIKLTWIVPWAHAPVECSIIPQTQEVGTRWNDFFSHWSHLVDTVYLYVVSSCGNRQVICTGLSLFPIPGFSLKLPGTFWWVKCQCRIVGAHLLVSWRCAPQKLLLPDSCHQFSSWASFIGSAEGARVSSVIKPQGSAVYPSIVGALCPRRGKLEDLKHNNWPRRQIWLWDIA